MLSEELKKILDGIKSDLITEDTKEKLSVLIEANVTERVKAKEVELDKVNEEFRKTEAARLEEEAIKYFDGVVIPKIAEYAEYTADEYVKENELAIVDGLKAQMFESFIGKMKTLLAEHSIVEAKQSEAEKVHAENVKLKAEVDSKINEAIEFKKKIEKLEAEKILESACVGLVDTQKAKLKELSMDYPTGNPVEYTRKINILKESIITSNSSAAASSSSSESDQDDSNSDAPVGSSLILGEQRAENVSDDDLGKLIAGVEKRYTK